MAASSEILKLPDEPSIGSIVEIIDGSNAGNRYRRDSGGWIRLSPYGHTDPCDWSSIWWAVTEDASGGTQVRVTIPDSADPHPLPWAVDGRDRFWDATGDLVPSRFVVNAINERLATAKHG